MSKEYNELKEERDKLFNQLCEYRKKIFNRLCKLYGHCYSLEDGKIHSVCCVCGKITPLPLYTRMSADSTANLQISKISQKRQLDMMRAFMTPQYIELVQKIQELETALKHMSP